MKNFGYSTLYVSRHLMFQASLYTMCLISCAFPIGIFKNILTYINPIYSLSVYAQTFNVLNVSCYQRQNCLDKDKSDAKCCLQACLILSNYTTFCTQTVPVPSLDKEDRYQSQRRRVMLMIFVTTQCC